MFTFLAPKLISALAILAFWLSPADFYQALVNQARAAAAPSPDAIALRIIPNPDHLSSVDWYKANIKTQGSPQAVIIDGFDAIRDGRTVYVNAANVDLANNKFYNNIYLLSFSQNAEQATEDIFGQLLLQWKFNTNITDQGQKEKIRNDTKRLSDLAKIRLAAQSYKNSRGNYPRLSSGSYLTGKTVSVWPSWQATLGAELGLSLPSDPINKLGPCPGGYDVKTCWNQTEKKFATDLNQPVFPAGSRMYFYSVDSKGENIKICGQMETNYSNIVSFNCFVDQLPNSAPVIKSVNLTGWPTQKFTGFISVSDPDEDNLNFTMELVEPVESSKWVNDYLWQWEAGVNGFKVAKSNVPGQIIVSAAKAGRVNLPGIYKVRFTVNDGKNQPNSVVSQVLDVQINPYPMELNSLTQDIAVGENRTFAMVGLDNSKQPIANLLLRDFSYNGSAVDMSGHGFSLNGASLSVQPTAGQRLGLYRANVYAVDATAGNNIESFFQINITNHPPTVNNVTARYANGTEQNGLASPNIVIDNGEAATIEVRALDPDPGHIVKYELVDNNTELAINRDSGIITGLERLNYHLSADRTYNIKVRAFDQYCAQSSQSACSVTTDINLTVEQYCSLAVAESGTTTVNLPGPYRIDVPGQTISLGDSLADCSEVGRGKVDVLYNGSIRSRAIVFVLDLSGSMNAAVGGTIPAYELLKEALIKNNGVFDKLSAVASSSPSGNFIKIGLVAFNSGVYPYPRNLRMVNLAAPGELANIKNEVEVYQADGGTNTLAALNKAEQMLALVTGAEVDKYVVLMSDGIPTVVRESVGITNPGTCQLISCGCGLRQSRDANGNCIPMECNPACPEATATQYWYCFCGECKSTTIEPLPPPLTPCLAPLCGYQPDCRPKTTCCDGTSGCNISCPQCPSLNDRPSFGDFFSRLLAPTPALAVTEQTQCLNSPTGLSCERCDERQGYYNSYCAYDYGDVNCNISYDVATQAQALKNSGVKIYSIYYNTAGTQVPAANMRYWSSDNGSSAGNYFFAGTNIGGMFDEALSSIVKKPKNVIIGGAAIEDTRPYYDVNTVTDADFSSALSCGKTELTVNFLPSPPSFLEFSRLRFEYCPAKLHP